MKLRLTEQMIVRFTAHRMILRLTAQVILTLQLTFQLSNTFQFPTHAIFTIAIFNCRHFSPRRRELLPKKILRNPELEALNGKELMLPTRQKSIPN